MKNPKALALTLSFLFSMPSFADATNSTQMFITQKNNRFGQEIYQKLLNQTEANQAGKNLFFSPISLSMALSMLYVGASGETRNAMQSALGYQGLAIQDLNAGSQSLLASLNHPGTEDSVTLSVANSVWLRDSFPVLKSYQDTVEKFYNADAESIPFDSKAPQLINAWVSKETHDKITQAGPAEFTPDMNALLINATYFKADWTTPFTTRETQPKLFNLEKGSTQAPTMSRNLTAPYVSNGDYQAISLAYGRDERASMIVVLPKEGTTLAQLNQKLSRDSALSELVDGLKNPSYGTLSLPKFSFKADLPLNDVLKASGLDTIFSSQAQFSALSPENVSVSQVLQKTFVDVNEKGTEAAAVTTILVGTSVARPIELPTFNMQVDRPFFFLIRDNKTGSILFMGSVYDPTRS